jgi:hypothetical protein
MKRLFEYAIYWGLFLVAIALWAWALTGFTIAVFFPLPR